MASLAARNELSPRERMLAALDRRQSDRVPCSFMMYKALHTASPDYLAFVARQVAMGLDACVQLPPRPPVVVNDHYNLHGLPVTYDPRVEVSEWMEHPADAPWPILVKKYATPAGALRAEVRRTDDWPWGDHVPFLDDHIVPRSRKFLVTDQADLASLRYLLVPPTAAEIADFRAQSQPALDLAHRLGLLVSGGWGVGADLVGWVYGLENMVYASYDQPAFLHALLDIVATWNRQRMAVVLDAGIDLYVKRAWYGNCDFWTPATFREFLFPVLQADAELAHARGARLGYIVTSNAMPLLETLAETGVDVLIGVDPHAWDLAEAKRKVRDRVCLWGGVNGHLTVEQGTPDMVRAEVRRAIEVLGRGGGFILSPVDNVRQRTERAEANVRALIDEWRCLTGQRARS